MWEMILQMTGAMLLYVLVTAGLWLWFRKKPESGNGRKIAVGLVFGACSVAANHIGIDYGSMVLNVRDIGPLSAGLFFSPLSGVLAGIIGGAERIMAGEIWGIGKFTEIACGLSTFLAGIIAAFMNRTVFQGKRPAMPFAFMLGAVTEVFHMYAVLFTNRASTSYAYYVVKIAAVPMIAFTAIGVCLCSSVIMKLSGEKDLRLKRDPEETPLTLLFQRSLLIVTLFMFLFNFIVSYNFQTRMVQETAEAEIDYITSAYETDCNSNGDTDALIEKLQNRAGDMFVLLFDAKTGKLLSADVEADLSLEAEELEKALEHTDRKPFITQWKMMGDADLLCSVTMLGEDYFLMTGSFTETMFSNRDNMIYESTLGDILLFTVLYLLVAMLADRLVVRNLKRVNKSLNRITNGHLDETVWVHSSSEFTGLSEDINKTVTALRGYIDQAEKRMQEELKLAAAIQESALPKAFNLAAKNTDLYALMTPAKQVGGDFYDFFDIGPDRLCLVIADVSGKGVPASLFMMRAKTAIKNYAQSGLSPEKLLQMVNNDLCEGNDAEMFVTVWLGLLDLKTGRMQCANAGHEYPIVMRAEGEYELLHDKHGLVLAAMNDIPMRGYEIQLNPGDRILVYTDGVPEAINEKNEAYGTDRLVSRLNRIRNNSQEYILQDVLQDIRNFAGSAEQFDDITMVGLTYLSTEG